MDNNKIPVVIEEEDESLNKLIIEKYNIETVKMIKRLTYYLSKVGLNFEESCTLIRKDPNKMKDFLKVHPLLREAIDMKELEYKKDLLTSVSAKARNGDEKLALWLLEKKFPGEFNTKKGMADKKEGDDIFGAAIEFVQRTSSGNDLVNEKSAKVSLVGGRENKEDLIKKLNEIMK